jgi:hypothetical protein
VQPWSRRCLGLAVVGLALVTSACGGGSNSHALSGSSSCSTFLAADFNDQSVLIKQIYREHYAGEGTLILNDVTYFCAHNRQSTVQTALQESSGAATSPSPSLPPLTGAALGNCLKKHQPPADVKVFLRKDVTQSERDAVLSRLRSDPDVSKVIYESSPQEYKAAVVCRLANATPSALPEGFFVQVKQRSEVASVVSTYANIPGVDQVVPGG